MGWGYADRALVGSAERQVRDVSSARSGYWRTKRILDLALVILTAPFSLVVVAITALAIRLDSPGPIIFKQQRVGARRAPTGEWAPTEFTLYKLRTMHHGSDPELHRQYMEAYIAGDETHMSEVRGVEGTYKMLADPRITRVGHVVRKLSLDELPQLWNVLVGDMSLVGPRPAIPYEVSKYEDWHMPRLACLPGLTGWWQVNGRGDTSFEEMVELDLHYLRHQSIWLDLRILARTIPVAVLGKGAG